MTVTLKEISDLVGLQLGKRKVKGEDRLIEDLGAESADMINIIVTAEDRFGKSFANVDVSKLRTVNQLYEFIKE